MPMTSTAPDHKLGELESWSGVQIKGTGSHQMETKDTFDVDKDQFGLIPEDRSFCEVRKSSFKNRKVPGVIIVSCHSTCKMTFKESLLATKTRASKTYGEHGTLV